MPNFSEYLALASFPRNNFADLQSKINLWRLQLCIVLQKVNAIALVNYCCK